MAPTPAAVVEIDFLGLAPPPSTARVEHRHHPAVAKRGRGAAGSSIRDIQKAVSRMDPDVLRSLIAAAPPKAARGVTQTQHNNDKKKIPPSAATSSSLIAAPNNPFITSRSPTSPPTDTPAPLTIFYEGDVAVFDVPPQVADLIIKTAETCSSLAAAVSVAETLVSDTPLSGLPLARKKSLRRFLQKRQQRLSISYEDEDDEQQSNFNPTKWLEKTMYQ